MPPSPAIELVPAAAARRLALLAAGLLDDPSGDVDAARVARVVHRLGAVQIDSINTVERAHHLILGARLDGYRPEHLAHALEVDRSLFEHWTHDAAAIPVEWFPHWRHTFVRHRRRIAASAWWNERLGPRRAAMTRMVRSRIEREGPLAARDFTTTSGRAGGGSWWGWTPEKAALEFLWHTGTLLIAKRARFEKVYDLAERVLPAAVEAPRPSPAAHLEWAATTALERLGIATAREIAGFWSALAPERVESWLRKQARRGSCVRVRVAAVDGERTWEAWVPADWEARLAAAPEAPSRLRLLAPFDPIVRDRKRAARLFGFDFAFEAFVPAAKRRFGYYVLPILEGDRFAGRTHPRFDRERGSLILDRVWWEPGVRPTRIRRRALHDAAARLAACIGARSIELPAD